VSDTIQSPPPDAVVDRQPTERPPSGDRPATAAALAAAFVDFEEKFFRQQASNHEEQMRAMRDGQSKALAFYQEARDEIRETLARFDDQFWAAIQELQFTTHDQKNALSAHTLQLGTLSVQVSKLEAFRAKVTPLLRALEGNGHDEDNPDRRG
jgi:hypothetical protein